MFNMDIPIDIRLTVNSVLLILVLVFVVKLIKTLNKKDIIINSIIGIFIIGRLIIKVNRKRQAAMTTGTAKINYGS